MSKLLQLAIAIRLFYFLKWLAENGFFTAPASTKYHGNYEGGLFDHSFLMMNLLVELSAANGLKWKRPESPFIVGMFHDLCKIDQYRIDNSTPLKDALKQYMRETGVDSLTGTEHKASYKAVTSSRIDTSALKKDVPEIAAKYTRTTESHRFTFS